MRDKQLYSQILGACPRITLFGKIRALQITQSTAETDVSLKI